MNILLIDDAVALAEMFANALRNRADYAVTVVTSLNDVVATLSLTTAPDLALIDLSFPHQDGSGIDALLDVLDHASETKLVIMTQGDEWVADMLRDAWEILPIATVISKSSPLDDQLAAIDSVLRTGSAPVDPVVQPLLPARTSHHRTRADFRLLVHHAGHAKLWLALRTCEPTYKALAQATGLKLNTLKNYRAQLLPELVRHGTLDPSLVEMRAFARRCWPFLRPWVEAARPT
jgi:DNA-binding NarL/FixJ family response regulator